MPRERGPILSSLPDPDPVPKDFKLEPQDSLPLLHDTQEVFPLDPTGYFDTLPQEVLEYKMITPIKYGRLVSAYMYWQKDVIEFSPTIQESGAANKEMAELGLDSLHNYLRVKYNYDLIELGVEIAPQIINSPFPLIIVTDVQKRILDELFHASILEQESDLIQLARCFILDEEGDLIGKVSIPIAHIPDLKHETPWEFTTTIAAMNNIAFATHLDAFRIVIDGIYTDVQNSILVHTENEDDNDEGYGDGDNLVKIT